MSIFSRLNDIIQANLNSLLEKAEDPEKLIRLAIQEMEETLVEVRSDAARLLADKKTLERHRRELAEEMEEWARKAELALRREREDLARAALAERHRLERRLQVLDQELAALDEELQKLNHDLGRLQAKLDDARARHQALRLRHDTRAGRLRTRRQLGDRRLDQALGRFETVERKMDRLEGRLEADEVGVNAELEARFAELEAGERIEQELARLRARIDGQRPA